MDNNILNADAAQLRLGQRLRELVERQRSYSVNRISVLTQTDRSSIYQCFDGKRLPTMNFLRMLVHILRLPEAEVAELFSLYHLARDDAWELRRDQELVSLFACARAAMEEDSWRLPLTAPDPARLASIPTVISSRGMLSQVLELLVSEEVFAQEEPRLDFFLSTPELLSVELLPAILGRCAFPEGKRLALRQVMEMVRDTDAKDKDIPALLAPLKLAVSLYCKEKLQCEPFITYVDVPAYRQAGALYPNCFIFTTAVVQLSPDGTEGVCIRSRETAAAWRQRFTDANRYSECLEMKATDFQSALASYSAFTDELEQNMEHYTISYSPVIYPQYTRSILDKYVHAGLPHREALVEGIYQYYHRWESMNQRTKHHVFFTEEGLMQFAREGTSSEIPPALVRTVEPEDRLSLLPDCTEGPWNSYTILNSAHLPWPRYLSVCISFKSILFTNERFDGRFNSLALHDPRLVELFTSFFRRLGQTEYVYPPSVQQEIWERAYAACREQSGGPREE